MKEKWFKKLKKILAEMPSDAEISVCVNYANVSTVRLHERGAVNKFEKDNDDRLASDWELIEIDSFDAANVIANSESI